MRKRFTILVFLSFLLMVPIAANADLIGNFVFGTLTFNQMPTNYWDPINNFVHSGAGPQPLATVGTTVEFMFQEDNSTANADFDGSSLTVSQTFKKSGLFANSWKMTFVDQSQAFSGLTLVSNSIPGLTWIFVPSGTIILDMPASTDPVDWSATFSVEAVPLPPTVWLFGSGLLGLAGWRKFRKG